MDTCDASSDSVVHQTVCWRVQSITRPCRSLGQGAGGKSCDDWEEIDEEDERDAHREKMFVCDVRNVQRGQRAAGPRRRSSLTEGFDQA